jgi:aminopeptidase N
MGLLAPDGAELRSETLILNAAEQTFVFEDVPVPPVPSLFRGFSAPVKLKGQSAERLAFFAAHDTDLFNRWDALQSYASQVLLTAVAAHQAGQSFVLDEGLRAALAATLAAAERDAAFAAEALLLPSETLLADAMEVVDPEAIRAVREAARAAIGHAIGAELRTAYAAFGKADPADISGAAMAQRALKNAALGYLCAAGDRDLAAAQFADARNMTDALAALTNLVEVADGQRDNALSLFYAQWQSNPLVLDKWFAVQARAGAPDTLARVVKLTTHPDFDMRNPNRVRALIGAFTANSARFHDAAGGGYKLLADTIITLDEQNPQVAARLATALGAWRRYDSGRQALMKAALERVLARERLSHNTYEMAYKALA